MKLSSRLGQASHFLLAALLFGPGRSMAQRRRGRGAVRDPRGDDPDARRRPPAYADLCPEGPGRPAAVPDAADPVRHQERRGQLRHLPEGPGRRGLHLRVPGPPRQIRVGGGLRHAAAGAGARRHDGAGRGDRYLRHHRMAAQERPREQRPGRDAGRLVSRLDDDHGRPRAAPRAQGDLAAGLAGRHVARRRLPPQRRVPAQLRLRVRLRARERQGPEALRLRPLRHLRLVPRRSARSRMSTSATSTARSRPGTTSSPTPTTTRSGSARR